MLEYSNHCMRMNFEQNNNKRISGIIIFQMLKTPHTGNKHSNTWTKTRRPAIFGEVSHEIKTEGL